MARRQKGSVDTLKDQLYSREHPPEIDPEERTPLSAPEPEPMPGWQDSVTTPTSTTPMSRRKNSHTAAFRFLFASIAFFIVAAGIATYLFVTGTNTISPRNIDLSVVMPSVVDGGKAASLQVLIHNRNQSKLKLVDLIITYPDGTRSAVSPQTAMLHDRQSIGDIGASQQLKRTAQAIFYGREGQAQKVTVQLQYGVEGSNAIFSKDATAEFMVGSSPVSISISAPNEIISGQSFAVDVTVQSNALEPIDNVVVQGQYPFGYFATRSAPQATAGNTLWRLGTLKPGESRTLSLTGTLEGQDGDARVFYFLAGSDIDQTNTKIPVPFLSVPQTLVVRRAFITTDIAINGKTAKIVAVQIGSSVQGTVTWTNNLPDAVSDLQLKLSLKGPILDQRSIAAQTGFYDSPTNSIIWSKDREPSLASVPPGGTGSLPFSFSLLPVGTGGTVYSNPAIDLALTIDATRQGQTGVPEQVSSAASTQVIMSTVVALKAESQHFSGPFVNTGPMPPVPGKQTTYAINWTVTNSSNTIANAIVTATLPTYVTYVGTQPGSGITYDSKSRTVTWTLGDVKAGAGYTGGGRTASFQVSLQPSTSQIGTAPALTSQAVLNGQDRFAQVPVSATADAVGTQLSNDAGYNPAMSAVVPQ